MNGDVDRILQEQARYYEDRAPEYDDVWYRRGRYDLGPEGNREFLAHFAPGPGCAEIGERIATVAAP